MTNDEPQLGTEQIMSRSNFENLQVYHLSERLSDSVWDIVMEWPVFAKDTVGKQIVRSADSIGANISEGVGRDGHAGTKGFVRTARGSLYETKHWLRRADKRKLLTKQQIDALKPIVDELAPRLDVCLRSIGRFPDNE